MSLLDLVTFQLIFKLLFKLFPSLPQLTPELEYLIKGLRIQLDTVVLLLEGPEPLEEIAQPLTWDTGILTLAFIGMEVLDHFPDDWVNVFGPTL